MGGILIVDDNASIRFLLRVFIETQTGFQVCGEAKHGVEAIQRAKELAPELVLLDLSMPILGGTETASVLKRTLPDVKIILFSMHMDEIPRTVAAKVGVDVALSKADGIARLGEHLRTLLAPTKKALGRDSAADISGAVLPQTPV